MIPEQKPFVIRVDPHFKEGIPSGSFFKIQEKKDVKLSSQETVIIRIARLEDAAPVARLCGQLGYVETTQNIHSRLIRLLPDNQHRILVAEVKVQ